jgi:hypothetical protein
MAGIMGIFFGLEQWGNFLGHYVTMFEKSLENPVVISTTPHYLRTLQIGPIG